MIKSSMRCFPWWAPGWCSAGHRGGEAAPWGAPSHGTDPPPAPLTFLPIDRRLLVYVELRRVGFCKEKGGWGTGIGSSWLWKGACPDTLVCTGAQATLGGGVTILGDRTGSVEVLYTAAGRAAALARGGLRGTAGGPALQPFPDDLWASGASEQRDPGNSASPPPPPPRSPCVHPRAGVSGVGTHLRRWRRRDGFGRQGALQKARSSLFWQPHICPLGPLSLWGGFPPLTSPKTTRGCRWPRGTLTSRLRGSSTCSMSE